MLTPQPGSSRSRRCQISQHNDSRQYGDRLSDGHLFGNHVPRLLDLLSSKDLRNALQAGNGVSFLYVFLRASCHHICRSPEAPCRLRPPRQLRHTEWREYGWRPTHCHRLPSRRNYLRRGSHRFLEYQLYIYRSNRTPVFYK